MTASSWNISLFEVCRDELGDKASAIRCARPTLANLSRRLENFVLSRQIPALICIGVQESAYRPQQALLQVARQICVFAGGAPSDDEAQPLYVELGSDDLLRREWFLVIQSARFAVQLLGRAILPPTDHETEQQFEVLWSFDPGVVDRTLDVLGGVIGHYCPERLAPFGAVRAAEVHPDLTLIADLMAEMLRAEDQLGALARFPAENPAPVLRIGGDGIVVYCNDAGISLLESWACRPSEPLPDNWRDFVARVLKEGLRKSAEVQFANRYYDLEFVPLADTRCVSIYGHDITRRKQLEGMMHESEVHYRTLINTSPDAILLVDPAGRIKFASPAAYKTFGVPLESELVGTSLEAWIDPEYQGIFTERREKLAANQPVSPIEYKLRKYDGTTFWGEFTTSPLMDAHGQVKDFMTVVRDTAERRRMEETLSRSEQKFRSIVEQSTDGISLVDEEGIIVEWNRSYEQITGLKRDEVVGRPLWDIQYRLRPDEEKAPGVYEQIKGMILELLRTGQAPWLNQVTQRDFIRADGVRRVIQTTVSVIKTDKGYMLPNIARDITERRQAEEALARERNLLRTLIDLLPDRIYIKDRQTRFIIKNEADSRQMGARSTEEVVGKTDFDYYPPDIAANYYADDMAVIESEQPLIDREEPSRDAMGNRQLILTTKVPLRDKQGQVIGLVGIGRDITERKRAEEAVRAERDRAQRYLDIAGVMLIALDVDQTVTLINRKGCEVLGYTEEEIVGKNWSDLCLPARFRPVVGSAFKKLMAGEIEGAEYYENPVVTCTGEERMIAWHNALLTDTAGHITGTLSSGEDITERKKAEAALHRWAHIFEHAEWGVVVAGPDGQSLELMNLAFARMHDHTVEELAGKRLADVFAPESQFALPERIRVAQVRGHHTFESKHRRKDGSYFPVLVDVTAVREETGRVLYHVVNVQDITERKQVEEAEREQRMLAEALHDTAAAINSTLNLDEVLDRILANLDRVVPHTTANIMLVESGIARMVRTRGYTDFVSDTWIRDSRYPVNEIPNLRRMAETGEPYVAPDTDADPEWVVYEETRWIRSYAGAPIQIKGEMVGFINLTATVPGFFSQKQADQLKIFVDQAAVAIANARLYDALRQYTVELEQRVEQRTMELLRAKDHAETILNNSSDAIIVAWANGFINQTNPAFCKLFGYKGDEVFKLPLLGIADPANAATLGKALDSVISSGQPARIELLAWRKDGTTFDAELALAPMRGKQGADIVCNLRDITQRKRMEQELRKMLEREKELNELKSRFVSTVSHEFRTPLTVILTSASLVKNYGHRLTEEQKQEQLGKIQRSVDHMVSLLEDVLTISRADSGTVKFEPVPLDLEVFCKHVIEDMQNKTHRLVFSAAGPCAEVVMDEQLLRQILANLLSNAVKYSPPGSTVDFDVRCDEREVVFRVQDEGIGIPPEDQKHIFEWFFRAKNAGHIVGTGLGLAIARRAAELHGGTISFESLTGSGTTFTVTLPRSR